VLCLPETISQCSVALSVQPAFYCKFDDLGRPDKDRQLPGPGQSGVEKIPTQKQVMLHERGRDTLRLHRFLTLFLLPIEQDPRGFFSAINLNRVYARKIALARFCKKATLHLGVQAEPSFMDFCWVWEQEMLSVP
jgi:hypothetical protein